MRQYIFEEEGRKVKTVSKRPLFREARSRRFRGRVCFRKSSTYIATVIATRLLIVRRGNTMAACSRSVYPPAVIASVQAQMKEVVVPAIEIPEALRLKPSLTQANLRDVAVSASSSPK